MATFSVRRRCPWQRISNNAVESASRSEGTMYSHMEWSPCSTWLALASQNNPDEGQVDFINGASTKSESDPFVRRSLVSSCSWHPSDSVFAIGWADGCLTLVCATREFEGTFQLTDSVLFLQWNHNGKSLCCLDRGAAISLFSYSAKNKQLSRIVDLHLDSPPCCVSIMLLNKKPDKENKGPDEEEIEEIDQKNVRFAAVASSSETGFLVGSDDKRLNLIDERGALSLVKDFGADIAFLGFFEDRRLLLVVTSDLLLNQIEEVNGKWNEKWKVKLTGNIESYRFLLADCLLIMTYCSRDVRVWDLAEEANGVISLAAAKGYDDDEVCICAAYSKKKGTISCGTSHGKVANFRRRHGEQTIASTWRLQTANQVGEDVVALAWSPFHPVLAVNAGNDIVILKEEHSIVSMKNRIAAIQSGPTSFTLLNVANGVTQELKLPAQVNGLHLGEKQLVVWTKGIVSYFLPISYGDGSFSVMTFDVQSSLATIQSTTFACEVSDVIIHSLTLFCVEGDKINARTMQGTVKQILSLPEMEGDPVLLNLNRHWLCVATSNGFIRIYDVSKKEARQEYHSKYVVEAAEDYHHWASVRVNILGTKVACSYYKDANNLSDRLLIWDAETDSLSYFSFDKGLTDQQENEQAVEIATATSSRPVTAAIRKMEKEQSRYRMMHHRPGAFQWDDNDERFLVCDCVAVTADVVDNYILTLFAIGEQGIQLHDLVKASQACQQLIGVAVPNMYFLKKSEYEDDEGRGERSIARLVVARILREFSGLENCDDSARKAMLDFSLHLSLGQMDEAFKAVQFIKSNSVWEQMASMSVKTRRLDVAAVCLGHMQNVRGARALRQAQQSDESVEMQCAAVALQLGMMDEAEAVYAANGRYDKVNQIHQAQDNWPEAFAVAEQKDRVHLRNTHFNYAKYCEHYGSLDEAVEHYERSETHVFEVPRMYDDNPRHLDTYVRSSREPMLQRWWARYLESIGEMDGAANFYLVGKEMINVVRIKALQGKVDEAAQLALESKDRAACYHMARVYEGEEDFRNAVKFYSKARAFGSAIRLAREHDMKDKLANLCLMAGGSEMVEAARYYENLPGYAHQAVMLYHKAGMIGRALDLAFRTEQFSALDLVVKDLDSSCEPNTLKRAAEFFMNNQNYEKAVELLSMAKEYSEAIGLCKRKNVAVTEKIAELLTPGKEIGNSERKELLAAVAELCIQQGSYIVAAKKFTQAGDRIRAMKALLRTGDIQKIRFFANTARSKNIYLLAANFLQTTEWQGKAEIIRDIETFYAKAQSPEHLANFYIACAHMEIDNWNDFEKAGSALEQALLCLHKALKDDAENSRFLGLSKTIHGHLEQLTKFQKIKEVFASDPTDAVRQLTSLAEEADPDSLISPTRILAMLIAHHAGKQNWTNAYRCIQQLQKQQPNLNLTTVVDPGVLDEICDQMRVERITTGANDADSDEDGEEVDFSHAMKKREQAQRRPSSTAE